MMRNRNLRVGMMAAVLGALAMLPAMGHAENLATRVPADAVAFFQWAGTDALGTSYESSHMKGLVQSLHLEKWLSAHMEKAHEGETDVQKVAREKAGVDFFKAVSKSPTGVYVGPVDFSDAEKPAPKIAIFSKMGGAAAGNLAKELTDIHEQEKKATDPPFAAVVVDDYLLVTIGADIDVEKRLVGTAPADGLGATEPFVSAMGQLGAGAMDSAALIYGNGEAALKIIDEAIAARAGAGGPMPLGNAQTWPKLESALGLGGIKQIALTGNFEGGDWQTQGFVGLAEERTGVSAMMDSAPLPPEGYALVPAKATWASVTRFDGSRFLDDMRNAAGNMGGNAQKQFDFALQQFFAYTGVDFKNDLLASMGDAYVFYGEPDAAGKSLQNFVMASKLKNAEKAEKALGTLESVIGAMVGQRDPTSKIQFKTEALAAPNDKTMAHMLPLGDVTPTWAIQGGVLYFSLSKEGVEAAVAEAGKGGTILENPVYAGLAKRIGETAAVSFSFADLPKLAPEFYELAAKALAERKAANKDGAVGYDLPPLAELLPNVTPSMQVTWTDKAGWHEKSIGPVPLVNLVGPQGIIVEQKIKAERDKLSATKPAEPLP